MTKAYNDAVNDAMKLARTDPKAAQRHLDQYAALDRQMRREAIAFLIGIPTALVALILVLLFVAGAFS